MVYRGNSWIDFIGGIRRGFIKKLWLDSVVEFPNRRRIKNIATNEETVVDVTREVGTVSQSGNQWSALEMNELEDRISSAFANVPTYDGDEEISPEDLEKIDADYLNGYGAEHYATKDDIDDLNADLTYKKLSVWNPTKAITIPSEWTEAKAYVLVDGDVYYEFDLIKTLLDGDARYLRNGHYTTASNYSEVTLKVQNNVVTVHHVYYNSTTDMEKFNALFVCWR